MEIGRHTEKAIVTLQTLGRKWYEHGAEGVGKDRLPVVRYAQDTSADCYRLARKLMGVE